MPSRVSAPRCTKSQSSNPSLLAFRRASRSCIAPPHGYLFPPGYHGITKRVRYVSSLRLGLLALSSASSVRGSRIGSTSRPLDMCGVKLSRAASALVSVRQTDRRAALQRNSPPFAGAEDRASSPRDITSRSHASSSSLSLDLRRHTMHYDCAPISLCFERGGVVAIVLVPRFDRECAANPLNFVKWYGCTAF